MNGHGRGLGPIPGVSCAVGMVAFWECSVVRAGVLCHSRRLGSILRDLSDLPEVNSELERMWAAWQQKRPRHGYVRCLSHSDFG
jgi:hypothetical protein